MTNGDTRPKTKRFVFGLLLFVCSIPFWGALGGCAMMPDGSGKANTYLVNFGDNNRTTLNVTASGHAELHARTAVNVNANCKTEFHPTRICQILHDMETSNAQH